MGNQDTKKWISLNVGGTLFQTNRSTLTKGTPQNSPLHRISTNSTNIDFDRDDKGAYLIDRDPSYFQPILNYLRHGQLILNNNISEEGVLLEAQFFNIPDLVNKIKEKIHMKKMDSLCAHFMNQSDSLTNYVNNILQDSNAVV